jgi:hypothetical protein
MFEITSNKRNSGLDLSGNSSEIYRKSRTIGPGPIQNCDFSFVHESDLIFRLFIVLWMFESLI